MDRRADYVLISAQMLSDFWKTETSSKFRGFSILSLQLHKQRNLSTDINGTYSSSMYWGINQRQWLNMLDERKYKDIIKTEYIFTHIKFWIPKYRFLKK